MNWLTVAISIPEHLFAQADALLVLYPGRKSRKTEIRRAISAAYYGVFHFVLAQAADMYVGAKYRGDPRYALAYRSISHTRQIFLAPLLFPPRGNG
jgi:hypothetical protein